MIRVQIACLECRQMMDSTFAANKVESMVAAFNQSHLFGQCREETPDGGEAQEEPAAGSSVADDGGVDEARRDVGGWGDSDDAIKH